MRVGQMVAIRGLIVAGVAVCDGGGGPTHNLLVNKHCKKIRKTEKYHTWGSRRRCVSRPHHLP